MAPPSPCAPPHLCTGALMRMEGSGGGRLTSWQMTYGKGAAPVMEREAGRTKLKRKICYEKDPPREGEGGAGPG